MQDFIMFMHADATAVPSADMWAAYFATLRGLKIFDGGSAIGAGDVFRKDRPPGTPSNDLTGYIRIRAETLIEAQKLLGGNPVFECGGTVEIRALPHS